MLNGNRSKRFVGRDFTFRETNMLLIAYNRVNRIVFHGLLKLRNHYVTR